MKIVFDEWYGELTFALRAKIRKHNVSPTDYRMLEDEFGQGNYAAIQQAIVERSETGMYHDRRSYTSGGFFG